MAAPTGMRPRSASFHKTGVAREDALAVEEAGLAGRWPAADEKGLDVDPAGLELDLVELPEGGDDALSGTSVGACRARYRCACGFFALGHPSCFLSGANLARGGSMESVRGREPGPLPRIGRDFRLLQFTIPPKDRCSCEARASPTERADAHAPWRHHRANCQTKRTKEEPGRPLALQGLAACDAAVTAASHRIMSALGMHRAHHFC